jgi:hypothetical protein
MPLHAALVIQEPARVPTARIIAPGEKRGRSVQNDPFHRWKILVIDLGIFLMFLATFGEYIYGKVRPVIDRLFP